MDTAIISICDHILAEDIRDALEDYGHLQAGIETENTLNKYNWTKGYRNQIKYKLGPHYVFIAEERFFDSLPPMRIGFHLSHFQTFSIFCEWLQTVLGIPITEKLFESPLYRLDLCIDLGVSYEDFEGALHQKRSTKVTTWKRSLRTLKIGTEAHQTYAYEKKINVKDLDYIPSSFMKAGKTIAVRLESRFRKHKIPCSCLRDLPTLISRNDLFSGLYLHGELKEIAIKGLPIEKRKTLYAFMYLKRQIGFEKARYVFNANRNYHRDIGRYLNTVQVFDLNLAWKNRTNRYFSTPPGSKSDPKKANVNFAWRA